MNKCCLFLIVGMFLLTLVSTTAFAQVTALQDTNSSGVNIDPVGFTGSYSNFYATWTGQAGANNYLVSVYNNGGADLRDAMLPSSQTSVSFITTAQSAGTIISIKVISYSNTLGSIGTALTSGVTVDTLINAGQVYDGTGADITFQPSTTKINANWRGFTDPSLSPSGAPSTITYTWAIGTTPGGADVLGFTAGGISGTTATASTTVVPIIPTLTVNTTYYVTVKATNSGGVSVTASSDGVTVKPNTLTATDLSGGGTTLSIPLISGGVFNYVNILDPVHDATGAITKPPPTDVFPYGVFAYTISGLAPYASVDVTYTLPTALSTTARWFWYNGSSVYSNWTDITDFVTRVSSTVFVAHLADGGIGDAGNPGDGKIIDPIGPGIPDPASAPTPTGTRIANALGLGGGGSCGVIGLDAIALIGAAYLFKQLFLRRKKK